MQPDKQPPLAPTSGSPARDGQEDADGPLAAPRLLPRVPLFVVSSGAGAQQQKRYLATFFAALVLLPLATAAANVAIDARDEFDHQWVEPLGPDLRDLKLDLYRSNPGPLAVAVLGSSRVNMLDPALVAPGERSFNWGLPASTPSDWALVYEHAIVPHGAPDILVVGVDPEQMLDLPHSSLSGTRFRQELTGEQTPAWNRGLALASWPYIQDSLRALRNAAIGGPDDDIVIETNGRRVYADWETDPPTSEEVRQAVRQFAFERVVRDYAQAERIVPQQVATVERLVEQAAAAGSTVLVVMPPLHPIVVDVVGAHPLFTASRERLAAAFDARCHEGIRFLDLTHMSAWNGHPDAWRDGWHIAGENRERVAERLASLLEQPCVQGA